MKQCLRSEIQIVQRESKDLMLVLEKYFGKKMSIFLRRGRIMVGNDLLHEKQAHGKPKDQMNRLVIFEAQAIEKQECKVFHNDCNEKQD